MKRAIIWIFALLLPLTACADQFKEGTHYTVVSQVGTAEPEVREFFSFLCGHCYNWEPIAHELPKTLPAGTAFNRTHVEFVGRDIGPYYSQAFAIAYVLGVTDTLVPAIFEQVQVKKRYASSIDELKQLFVDNGVKPEAFDSAANSFPVSTMVAQMRKQTTDSKITGVPSFIVNGKYKINMKEMKSLDMFNEVVKYLIAKG